MPKPAALVVISTVFGGPGAVIPGVITGPGGIGQYADGAPVSVVGDAIASHGPGAHIAATMVTGSPDTFINGIPLVRVGDQATCLCTVQQGDEDTFVG